MLPELLNIRNGITIHRRTVTPDGQGGVTTATVSTTLARAALWQQGGGTNYLSEKMARDSTHVLAIETGAYTFTDQDADVTYGTNTYKIRGHADDVGNRGEITIAALERIT
jgi:hypothetical protein